MPQVFHPSFNVISRVTVFGAVFFIAGALALLAIIERSDYVTGVSVVVNQPVPFSHSHHVRGLGIDCRYCHTSVEDSAFAGIPSTEICMNCHKQIWNQSPMLAPVRESYRTNEPLRWHRVHDLPDYAYFNHSIHVAKGVGCSECHGRIDEMPLVWQVQSLQMEWCLECHREPERFVRPREEVFNMAWEPEGDRVELGRKLVEEYGIRKVQLDDCSVCHR